MSRDASRSTGASEVTVSPSTVPAGVLRRAGDGVDYAWCGVRITAAADLTETAEYSGVAEDVRRRKTLEADIAYLRTYLAAADGTVIDLRWRNEPATRTLSASILGRVRAGSVDGALDGALALRHRLTAAPRHIQVAPLVTDDELAFELAPFGVHPEGAAEIRKRCVTGIPGRPDAGVAYYFAVQPWHAVASSWEPLLQVLAHHPQPVMLSIAIEPVTVPAHIPPLLESISTHYGRLAKEGEWRRDTLYSGPVKLTPDTFAVDAEKLYADATRRYRDRCVRVRVALASSSPLDDGLIGLVAATISPAELGKQRSYLSEQLVGAAFSYERPQSATDLSTFSANLSALATTRWGGSSIWEHRHAPPQALRLITEIVDPTEACAAFRLPAAINGHLPGFPVRRPALSGATTYVPSGPAVAIGNQVVNDVEAGPLSIEVAALTKHMLCVGAPGSGKTNTTLALCRSLWVDHRVPFLVIEPVNSDRDDYRWLATQPGMAELVVLTAADERLAPLRLNPFQVPRGVRVGEHIATLLQCFDATFGLWDPLPVIYNRALRAAYLLNGLIPDDIATGEATDWPTLAQFVSAMRAATDELDYEGEIKANIMAAARLRAESLLEGSCGSTLDCRTGYPMAELLARPVVVELAAIGDNRKEQSLITALLLAQMTEYYKSSRPVSQRLEHVTIVEEAHRLLGKPAPTMGDNKEGNAAAQAAEAFANTIAENRKYGEGIVIVEQVPTKLVSDAYKSTNLKVLHKLPAEEDRRLIGGTMRFNADQERYAGTLEPFTGFVHHDALDRPALVRVPNVRREAALAAGLEEAPMPTREDLRDRFLQFAAAVPEVNEALAPYAECAGCAHRCQFRPYAKAMVTPAATQRLFTRLQEYPAGATEIPAWWQTTLADVATLARPVRPRLVGADEAAAADLEACTFLHLLRGGFEGGTTAWAELYRTHRSAAAEPGPPGPPAS